MKKNQMCKAFALVSLVSCLTSAVSAADVILAEAYSEPTGLNNLTNKPAAILENLLLPKAWGDESAATLTVVGRVIPAEETEGGTNYLWDTSLYPDVYLVQLAYGSVTNTALFSVTALAKDEWGTLDLDNLAVRTAADSEPMTLPAAWGETGVTDLKLVYTDELGGTREIALDGTDVSTNWNTRPLFPGAWTAKLVWNGGASTEGTASYVVAAAAEQAADEAAAIDNFYDGDAASGLADVRDIANHTNVFQLSWLGVRNADLSLDGDAEASVTNEIARWQWNTNELTYALYTFTNNVDGSNCVARFRVNAKDVAVMFHRDTNDVIVTKAWAYGATNIAADASRKVISDRLKLEGPNGLALWKSYVLDIAPTTTVDLASNIAVTNVEPNVVQVTVWPANLGSHEIREGSKAAVSYAIEYTDGLETPLWHEAKNLIGAGDVKFTETLTNKVQRFYRTNLDVQPTAKEQATE